MASTADECVATKGVTRLRVAGVIPMATAHARRDPPVVTSRSTADLFAQPSSRPPRLRPARYRCRIAESSSLAESVA
jgi:hypothetical protein